MTSKATLTTPYKQKGLSSTTTAPEIYNVMFDLKRKFNTVINNPEVFFKVKIPTKFESDKYLEYVVGAQEEDSFKHELESRNTVILSTILDYVKLEYLSPEMLKLKNVFEYISTSTISLLFNNALYAKKFSIFRNQKLPQYKQAFFEDIVKSTAKKIIEEVFCQFYNQEKFEVTSLMGDDFEKHSYFVEGWKAKMTNDFFSTPFLFTSMSLHGIIEKLTDTEIWNCLYQNPYYFEHYLNYTLSPIALSLSFFHNRLLEAQKDTYNPKSLPRCTYISFTGVFSETEIDILSKFSDKIQIIVLYDDKTGGPSFSSPSEDEYGDMRFKKKRQYGDNIYLLPINTDGSIIKTIYPHDILAIFKLIIYPLIHTFNPEYIIFNHSFNFSKESPNPFFLDPKTLGKIIRLMGIASDFKLLVYPFKIPNRSVLKPTTKPGEIKTELMDFIQNMAEDLAEKGYDKEKIKKICERHEYIHKRYGTDYDRKYFRNCYVATIETMNIMKKYSKSYKDQLKKEESLFDSAFTFSRKSVFINPYLYNTLERWVEAYISNPNAQIFGASLTSTNKEYSKRKLENLIEKNEPWITQMQKYVALENKIPTNVRMNALMSKGVYSRIPIYYDIHATKDNSNYLFIYINLGNSQSKMPDTEPLESYYLDNLSQYYVKYPKNSETDDIKVFIFNCFSSLEDSRINIVVELKLKGFDKNRANDEYRTYLPLNENNELVSKKHPIIEISYQSSHELFKISQFRLSNENLENEFYRSDFGITEGKSELFLVYGYIRSDNPNLIQNIRESEDIICLNMTEYSSKIMKTKHNKKSNFPRHLPSACWFQKDEFEYLVITSGEVCQSNKLHSDDKYDIFNNIEIYRAFSSTNSTNEKEYEFHELDKDKYHGVKNLSFRSHPLSYIFYYDEKIVIFGGFTFDWSVSNLVIDTFEISTKDSIDKWAFSDHLIFLNKGLSRIDGNIKTEDFVPIGDRNKNFYISDDPENRFIRFIYPHSDRILCSTYFFHDDVITVPVLAPSLKPRSIEEEIPIKDTIDITARYIVNYFFNYESELSVLEVNDLTKFGKNSVEKYIDLVTRRLNDKNWPLEKKPILEKVKKVLEKYAGDELLIARLQAQIRKLEVPKYELDTKVGFKMVSIEKVKKSNLRYSKKYIKRIPKMRIAGEDGIKFNMMIDPALYSQIPYKPNVVNPSEYEKKLYNSKIIKLKRDIQIMTSVKEDLSNEQLIKQKTSDLGSIAQQEMKIDIQYEFKKAIVSGEAPLFLNKIVSEIIQIKNTDIQYRYTFKVMTSEGYRTLALHRHNAVYCYKSAVITYIDSDYYDIDPIIAKEYANQILFSDWSATSSASKHEKRFDLEFKSLYTLKSHTHITNRCLIMNKKGIFLIGGVIRSTDGISKRYSSSILKINYHKDLEDPKFEEEMPIELLEKSDQFYAINLETSESSFIFCCSKNDPSYVYKLSDDGVLKQSIPIFPPQNSDDDQEEVSSPKKDLIPNKVFLTKLMTPGQESVLLILKKAVRDKSNPKSLKYKLFEPGKSSKFLDIVMTEESLYLNKEDSICMDRKAYDHLLVKKFENERFYIVTSRFSRFLN